MSSNYLIAGYILIRDSGIIILDAMLFHLQRISISESICIPIHSLSLTSAGSGLCQTYPYAYSTIVRHA
jgi:hypothetical protein